MFRQNYLLNTFKYCLDLRKTEQNVMFRKIRIKIFPQIGFRWNFTILIYIKLRF